MNHLHAWALGVSLAVAGGTLARADDQPGAKDMFSGLDTNGDGVVAAGEVTEDQKRFYERLLRIGDKNDDGALSRAEFEAASTESERPVENGPPGAGNERPRPPFEAGAMIKRLDADNNGLLSKAELDAGPEPLRAMLSRVFDRLGKDELTKDEIKEAMKSPMARGPGGMPGMGQQVLKRMDANGNGSISKDELPEVGRERWTRIFDRLGKDEIAIDELARVMAQRGPGGPPGGAPPRPDDGEMPADRGEMPAAEGEMAAGTAPPGFSRGPMGPGGFRGLAVLRVLDLDGNGSLSRAEIEKAAEKFDELDRNGDGELIAPELMGFFGPGGGPGGPGAERGGFGRGFGGPPGGRGFGAPGGPRREGAKRPPIEEPAESAGEAPPQADAPAGEKT